MSVGFDELNRRMGYHPATPDTIPVFEANRANFIDLADLLDNSLPDGREKSLALTALQEALMWANAAVACQTPVEKLDHALCNARQKDTSNRCTLPVGHTEQEFQGAFWHRDGSVYWS